MKAEELCEVVQAQPFRSFRLHLADGRNLPVKHREFIMISPTGRTAFVYQPDGSFNIVDLVLVTDLSVGAPAKPRTTRRKRA